MHRGSAPARRSGVAAVLALVAVLRIHRGPGSLVDRRPGVGGPKCLRRPIGARAATALGERRPLRLPRPIRPLARRARAARRDHAVSGKHRRPWSSGDGGPPAVHRGAERAVGARHLLVLPLHRSDADMTLVLDRHLRRGRTHRHAARAAVEADAIHPRLVDDRVVVDVRNVGDVDVGDGAVVVELVSAPVAALKAAAEIAEAVVDAAVETDVRTPIARVPEIETVAPAPVSRRPEEPHRRRQLPGSGHPVVLVVVPRPVPGDPDVAGRRTGRLHVHRERGRCDADRYADEDGGVGRHRERCERERCDETADRKAHWGVSLLRKPWPTNTEPRLNRGHRRAEIGPPRRVLFCATRPRRER